MLRSDMKRNPILNFHNTTIKFIGDCHLGKTFKRGVPLSKYGLREESLFTDLKNHLKEFCLLPSLLLLEMNR